MLARVGSISRIIEKLAPLNYAYKWDNVGLQLGYEGDTVKRLLVTLEVTDKVLQEAVEKEVDLIISHHPMIFSPLKSITRDNFKGRFIYKAIENKIAIYAAHTNIDIAPNGLNDYIVKRIGIEDARVLDIKERTPYYKLAVFIPLGHEEKLADAISRAGAGHIGNYSHCSFRLKGTGTFKPLEGTNPFIGSKGQLEKVEEIRLETIVGEEKLKETIEAMIQAHPYEEVAYDLYPLANEGPGRGIGRYGKLDRPRTLRDLVAYIKEKMDIGQVKVAGDLDTLVDRLAVINGSGAGLIEAALYKGCQCVVTGDVKYHEAQDAISQGINVVDIGHYDSEKIFVPFMAQYLKEEIGKKGLKLDIIESSIDINPFQFL